MVKHVASSDGMSDFAGARSICWLDEDRIGKRMRKTQGAQGDVLERLNVNEGFLIDFPYLSFFIKLGWLG